MRGVTYSRHYCPIPYTAWLWSRDWDSSATERNGRASPRTRRSLLNLCPSHFPMKLPACHQVPHPQGQCPRDFGTRYGILILRVYQHGIHPLLIKLFTGSFYLLASPVDLKSIRLASLPIAVRLWPRGHIISQN
jgi:hypothetical protein